MTINHDLLKQVHAHVTRADRLRMSWWASADKVGTNSAPTKESAECNTTACIAGWVAILGGRAELVHNEDLGIWRYTLIGGPWDTWSDTAYRLLLGEGDGGEWDMEEYTLLRNLFFRTGDEAAKAILALVNQGEDLGEAMVLAGAPDLD